MTWPISLARLSLFLLLLLASLTSCSQKADDKKAGDPIAGAKPLVVLAAASTKEAMEELAAEFKKSSGIEVKISAGPSNALANQIIAGGEAHVFLSANQQWADAVEKAGLALKQRKLLTNGLVMVVPKGNPAKIQSPKDLLNAGVKKVALAGEKVPAGMYAQQALTKLMLYEELEKQKKVVRGQDVRSTLTYVERGEAEAGVVYSTDALMTKQVETVNEFDPATYEKIVYPAVLLKAAEGNETAGKFFDFLASPAAAEIFKRHGFAILTP